MRPLSSQSIARPPRPGLAVLAAIALSVSGAASLSAAAEGDREYGAFLSGECVTCHQITGGYDGIPPIVGWPPETFVHAMEDYRDGARPNEVMRNIAARYSDEELAALAAYFGSIEPGSGAR